jgi:AsmA protein
MKKRHVWIGAAVFLCLFAAAAWEITHPNFVVAQLQDYVMRRTGRALVVKGGATLTLFPNPRVRLDDVTIANPSGTDGIFVNVGHAELPISMGDLFRRRIKIHDVTLSGPRFNFLVDARGLANWVASENTETSGKSDKTSKPKDPLSISIEDGSANFLDERNGQSYALGNATGLVRIGGDGELDVSGTAALNSQFATIEAHLNSLARVAEDGSPVNIAIKAPAITLNFDGRVGTRDALNLAGTMEATAPDLRALSKWLGSEIGGKAGLKNFSLAAGVDSLASVINLRKATVGLDGMTANGELTLDLSKKPINVSATLSTHLLDLDTYLETAGGGGSATPDWATTPLEAGGLKGVEGRFSLSAFLVKWKEAQWGPVTMTGTLRNGILEAGFQDGSLYGGKADLNVTLNGTTDVPALQVAFDGHDFDGAKFFSQLAGLHWLAGTTALKTSFTASGRNQQEMMAGLRGDFSIGVRDGTITGLDIMERISKVSSAILNGWGDGPKSLSTITSASASFAIEDGIAKSTDVQMSTPAATITGRGEVDMLRQALDFKFDPQIVTGTGEVASLPVQLVVKGPWNAPRIYPDVAGILDNPDAAYKTLRDLGLPEVSGGDVKKLEKKGKKFLKKLFGN